MSTAARRRRRRAALLLTALVALLAAIGIYAYAFYQGWLPTSDEAKTADTAIATTAAPSVAPAEVTVNVYNASGASGVAGRTASALQSHGYQVDAVDNAPAGTEVPKVAAIHYGPQSQDAAELLKTLVPKAELVADTREIDEIDLYIGTDFEDIEPAEDDSAKATD